MTSTDSPAAELEDLWAGGFGNEYLERNAAASEGRGPFWDGIVERYPSRRVLEIGCTQGDNLIHLARHVPAHDLWGLDVNEEVLDALHRHVPGSNGVWGVARSLPFRDAWFDLVFTVGLLIHQPDETLPMVMSEIVRCSRRWVLCGEYHADERTEITYRGHDGVLVKRPYGRLYQELFPELVLREEKFLTKDEGFDRVTFQIFEKT